MTAEDWERFEDLETNVPGQLSAEDELLLLGLVRQLRRDCTCGHPAIEHIWHNQQGRAELSGCGEKRCSCDHYVQVKL